MTQSTDRLMARALHQSSQDGLWIYEWNNGDVGKLAIPDGFTFDPRASRPIYVSSPAARALVGS